MFTNMSKLHADINITRTTRGDRISSWWESTLLLGTSTLAWESATAKFQVLYRLEHSIDEWSNKPGFEHYAWENVSPSYCHSKVLNQPKHLQNATNVDRREAKTNRTAQTRKTIPAVETSMFIQREEEKANIIRPGIEFPISQLSLLKINRFFVVLN